MSSPLIMRISDTLSLLFACIFFCSQALAEPAETSASQLPAADAFTQAVMGLQSRSFDDKAKAIEQLTVLEDARALPLFQALLAGDLFYQREQHYVVILSSSETGHSAVDAIGGTTSSNVDKAAYKKITINNKLRGQLRGSIAQLHMSHTDPAVRLSAAQELLTQMDSDRLAQMQNRLPLETDAAVREVLLTGIAMAQIDSDDAQQRLTAIQLLGKSNHPEAKQRLLTLVSKDGDGKFQEADKAVITAAQASLHDIEGRSKLYGFAETVFFGLSLGSVLLLTAIGLAITFGVMGVINMAHGELMMLGAYTTYVVQLLMPNYIDYSLFIAVPAAFLVAGLTGIAIERGIIRHLYGRPLETLLATFGISLILQQLVRSVFSPLNRSVETPSWMSGSWEINSMFSLTYNRLYILAFALIVFAALVLILKKTRLGLQVRAVSQNRAMARAMGVSSNWVDALTFGLGSGIAGVAGVALSQLTNVGPNLGQGYIIDSFMVVVFGGVGNLWGTFVGAMSLGVINKFMEPWSGAVLAKIIVLVFIILFIQKRPRGLFPQKGRTVEN